MSIFVINFTVWFVVHVPAVVITFTFCIVGILFATGALIIACRILYSKETSVICIIIGIVFLLIFTLFFVLLAVPVFKRVDYRLNERKAAMMKSRQHNDTVGTDLE